MVSQEIFLRSQINFFINQFQIMQTLHLWKNRLRYWMSPVNIYIYVYIYIYIYIYIGTVFIYLFAFRAGSGMIPLFKPQRILCVSFSRTDCAMCTYYLFSWLNLSRLHNSQFIPFPAQSSLLLSLFCTASNSKWTRVFSLLQSILADFKSAVVWMVSIFLWPPVPSVSFQYIWRPF